MAISIAGRSREGAWIEIASLKAISLAMQDVAPVRERGLKSCGQCLGCRLDKGRSREGAWIEMPLFRLSW